MEDELEILKNLVKSLREKLSVKAVILFGSRSRGDQVPSSDYDILIFQGEIH